VIHLLSATSTHLSPDGLLRDLAATQGDHSFTGESAVSFILMVMGAGKVVRYQGTASSGKRLVPGQIGMPRTRSLPGDSRGIESQATDTIRNMASDWVGYKEWFQIPRFHAAVPANLPSRTN